MKKIISLILVVLLCLPASFMAVSAEGADTFTIIAADGATTTSNDYLNIYKYLLYFDGGDTISIPANYITVGQWKANIANPAINANGVADDDFITETCTLTLTMDDGSTTKAVEFELNDYNHLYKKIDNTAEFVTSKATENPVNLTTGGASGTIARQSVKGDTGLYSVVTNLTNQNASAGNRYLQIAQYLSDINEDLTTPFICEYVVSFDKFDSLTYTTIGFTEAGKQKANFAVTGFKAVAQSGNDVKVSIVVFPKADRADVYVNDQLIKENFNIADAGSSFEKSGFFFVRFYNNTKVEGSYQELAFKLKSAEIRYGFGNFDDQLYVEPLVTIENYYDAMEISEYGLLDVEASVNNSKYNKATLLIDGIQVSTADVVNLKATLPIGDVAVGDHTMTVKMSTESGDFISKVILFTVTEIVPVVEIENYSDGSVVSVNSIYDVKAKINKAEYKRAVLLIDGVEISSADVESLTATLPLENVDLGSHTMEVRMYKDDGTFASKTISFDVLTYSVSEDADLNSNEYLNIHKYFEYYNGGEEFNIPKDYITVGQWKKNITNPAINAGGLSDDDYITNECTLEYTLANGTIKTIYFNVNENNYLYNAIDNSASFSVSAATQNPVKVTTGGGGGTISRESVKLDNGMYGVKSTLTELNASAANRYLHVSQNLSDIKDDITTPFICEYVLSFDNHKSLTYTSIGFTEDGKQKANFAVTGFKPAAQSGNDVKVSIVVFPRADRADVYVNDQLIKENFNIADADSSFEKSGTFFVRFYNNTKVDGEYLPLSMTLKSAVIKYGFADVNADLYIPPVVIIDNYTDGMSLSYDDISDVTVYTNKDVFKKAVLLIDGVEASIVDMNGLSVTLPIGNVGYGNHTMEVRLYPETGEYISKEITFNVADMEILTSFVIDYEDYGETGVLPQALSNPATGISKVSYINISNPGVNNSGVLANDALVQYYDEARGNVLHAKAADDTDTSKEGRRIEMTVNSAYELNLKFDFNCKSFIGGHQTFVSSRSDKEHIIVQMTSNGMLKVNTENGYVDFVEIDTDKWYTLEVEMIYSTDDKHIVTLYDADGVVIDSMVAVHPESPTSVSTARIYCQYNSSNLSGEIFLDNITLSPLSLSSSISDITATTNDLNTVSVVVPGANVIDDVELIGSLGEIEIFGFVYDAESDTLSISTKEPLSYTDNYKVSVYMDGKAIPMTAGFELEGKYIKVTDGYFDNSKNKDYVAVNVNNTTEETGEITLLISEWYGEQLVSTKAKTIEVAAGKNTYKVEITGDVSKTRVMPVMSLAKPILLSKTLITK